MAPRRERAATLPRPTGMDSPTKAAAMPARDPVATAATRRARWLLSAFVVVGLLLRVPFLGRSVWFDEACMSDQRLGTWAQLLATLYVDIHPPLYVTFMHFWNGVFGDSELSLRLPPLLAGLASIPLVYWTGHRLVGPTAALWGALLLALSPVHVWYSAEGRLYSSMIACTLVAVGTFDRLLDGKAPHPRWLGLLHVTNLAVMLALHYYLAIYVVALGALAPIVARGFTAAATRLMAWHGLGLVLLGGFVIAKRALGEFETSQDYLRAMTPAELYQFVFDWCLTGHTLATLDGWLGDLAAGARNGLGVGLTALGLWHIWRSHGQQPRGFLVPVCLLLIPLFLMATASWGLGRTYLERSALPALPFVFLLVGSGLAALRRPLHRIVGACVLLLGTASLTALFRFHETQWTVYKPNSDWRAATAFLAQEIAAGAAGRPVFTSTPNPRPLSYYDVRIQDVKNLTDATSPARIGDAVRKRLGGMLGDYAERMFRDFAEHNQKLLAGAALRVYRSVGDPAQLDLEHRMRDDVCYLVRDHWHPHVSRDGSVEALLAHPRVRVLEAKNFVGISVYKVRIAP